MGLKTDLDRTRELHVLTRECVRERERERGRGRGRAHSVCTPSWLHVGIVSRPVVKAGVQLIGFSFTAIWMNS